MRLLLLALTVAYSWLFSSASESYIVNGVEATVQRPYLVNIQAYRHKAWQPICGGSLLTTTKVLTAGHCMIYYDEENAPYRAMLGFLNISEPADGRLRQITPISGYSRPADYNNGTGYHNMDVALLTLQVNAVLSDNVGLVTLSSLTSAELVGQTTYLEGWGQLRDKGPTPDVLQHIELEIKPDSYCLPRFGRRRFLPGQHLCGLNTDQTPAIADTCGGDSGSPMMLNGEQVGLLSFGTKVCGVGAPSVYGNVAYFRDWIDANKDLP